MKSTNQKIKEFILRLLPAIILITIAFIGKEIVFSGKTNSAVSYSEVIRPGYETSPAFVRVSPSTSKAWELTKKYPSANVWKAVGAVSFWFAVTLLLLFSFDVLPDAFEWCRAAHVLIALMLLLIIWLAGTYAAYDAIYTNNCIDLPVPDYESLKAIPGAIDKLFDSKEIIR